jgi:hypothetical protein
VSLQTWQETLISAQVDGTALTASTTATSILPAAARYTLPANYFSIGKAMRIKAWGRMSNIVTTPGTLTLDIRMGPTSNIIVFTGGAISLNAVAQTNESWMAEIALTCRAIGSGSNANLMGEGIFYSRCVVGCAAVTVGTAGLTLMPDTAPAVGTGFDSTVSMTVDMFATWSLNNANSIQIHQFTLESLN